MPEEAASSDSAHSIQSEADMDTDRHSPEQEVDLMDIAILLVRGKRTIARFMLATTVLTVIVVYLVMKPMYTAEAVFLPPQNTPGRGMAQLASQLGVLGVASGLGGVKSPGQIYIGILGSRTIADTLIKRFDLQRVYKKKRLSDTEKELKDRSKFVDGKDTLITIKVEDHDPRRAADIANGYLDALHDQNGKLALTDSAQRRLFFQQQLEREKDALEDAEVDLKKTQEKTGLIAPGGQTFAEIQASSDIRAQIVSRQIELAALKQSATDQNPSVIRLQTEIAGLQAQQKKFESGTERRQPGNMQLPTAKMPALALEYVRKQREVKYHETLFELIAKQYETARLDEAQDAPLLQVVDPSRIPDKKSGVPRVLLVIIGCFLGILLGSAWVLSVAFLARLREMPSSREKLNALKQASTAWP